MDVEPVELHWVFPPAAARTEGDTGAAPPDAPAYDEIVVDVGGRDTGSLRAALTIANVVLVPFQPRSVDLWASGQVEALVAEAKVINDALRAYSLITLADTQG